MTIGIGPSGALLHTIGIGIGIGLGIGIGQWKHTITPCRVFQVHFGGGGRYGAVHQRHGRH